MRRKGILVLVVLAVLTVGVGVALAAKKYSTAIRVDGVSGSATDATVFGHLDTNRKCLGPRLMEESKQTSTGFKVVDQDYSSANGAYAFKGDVGPLPANIRIEVTKAKIRNRKGKVKVVCKPDRVQFTLSASKLSAG